MVRVSPRHGTRGISLEIWIFHEEDPRPRETPPNEAYGIDV